MILADDIAVMNNGKVEQFARKEDIFKRPKNEFIAKFVGVETFIEGEISSCKGNVCRVKVVSGTRGDIGVFVAGVGERGKKVILAIRPEDVILYENQGSTEKSSAMNKFVGKITGIRDIGIFKKVEIDCGFDLNSFVTQDSISRLGLAPGKKISAGVKASSIHMLGK